MNEPVEPTAIDASAQTAGPGIGRAWTGLLVAATVVRLAGVDAEGFWFDEVMQVIRAANNSFVELWNRIPVDKPPLAFYVLWPLTRVSLAESWLRMPSLLAGVATVGMIGLLARSAAPRPVGPAGSRSPFDRLGSALVIASLALAVVSPLAVKLSCEVLPYSAATAWVCLSYLAALRARERNGGPALLVVGLSAALALWTSFHAATALIPLGVVALGWALRDANGRQTAAWIAGAVLLGAVSAAPLLLRLIASPLPETQWAVGPFWSDTLPLVFGGLSAGFDAAPANTVWLAFTPLVAIGIFAMWSSQPGSDAAVLLTAWLGLGLTLLIGSAYAQDHWIAVRYVLFFVPPWLVLCAWGAVQLARWLLGDNERTRWIVAACVGLLVVASLPILAATHSSRPDHRGLAAAIAADAQPGDLVVFQNRLDEVPYLHYRWVFSEAPPPSVSVQLDGRENPTLAKQLDAANRVWVPELVYDTLPMRGGVREFFLPGEESVRRGPVALRAVAPQEAAAALIAP